MIDAIRDAVRTICICIALSVSTGCALTDADLEVTHDERIAQSGVIAEAPRLTFVRGEISDDRDDKVRIGYKRTGFGEVAADITSKNPVGEVVMNALGHAMTSNGHNFGDRGVEISGSVSRFRVDTMPETWGADAYADIEVALRFSDTATGDALYERTYNASYIERRKLVSNRYKLALAGALQAFIDEVVFDDDLAAALKVHGRD